MGKASPLYNSSGQIVGAIESIRDISDRKKAEEELHRQFVLLTESEQRVKKSEQNYRDLFENSVVGIFRTTLDGRFSAINTTFARISGYSTPEEMMAEVTDIRCQLYVNEDDRDRFTSALMKDGSVKGFVAQFLHRDGHPVWIKINANAVRDYQDSIRYYEGTIEDISEQKKTEEERNQALEQITIREEELVHQLDLLAGSEKKIRESETKFRSVFDKSSNALMIIEDGRLVDCNKQTLLLFGYDTLEEMADLGLLETSPEFQPDGQDSCTAAGIHVQAAFDHGDELFEWVHKRKDGSTFIAEVYLSTFENNGRKYLLSSVLDVTDRKSSEEALRQSETLLREAQKMAHLGFWSWDIKTGTVEWSDEVFRIFGLDQNTFIPAIDSILALSPWPEESQRGEELIRITTGSHTKGSYEQRFLRPDNSIGYYQSTFEGRYDDDGSLVTIIGTVLDITEQKRAGNALRESEEKYRKLFEESNDAIFFADIATRRLVDCNRKAEILTGYSREELLTMDARDLHPPDIRKQTMESFQTFIEGKIGSVESSILTREGNAIPVSINAGPPTDIGGRLILISIFRDITWQKEVEQRIREKTQEIDKFFSVSLDLFCIADTRGYFHRLNPEWERTLGYTLSELEGSRFLDLVHPDDLKVTLNAVSDLENQKEVISFVNRYRHRNGTYRWIEWRSFPAGDRIFAAARDITRRYEEERYMAGFNALKQDLLRPGSLEDKLGKITDCCIQLFGAFSACIWITSPGDRCDQGCTHATEERGSAGCTNRRECLHLVAQSGRYHQENGEQRRIPSDDGIIGRVIAGSDPVVIIPDVSSHSDRSDPEPVSSPGIVSFVGIRLISSEGLPVGVLGLFCSEQIISDVGFMSDLASTTSQVIQTIAVEDALRESEERYRNIIEKIQDVFFRIDTENRIVMASPSAALMFGYDSAGDLIGMPVLTVWKRAADRDAFIGVLKKQGGMIQGYEAEFKKKDGSPVWVSMSGNMVTDANGNYAGTEGILHDITGRKKAEEAVLLANKKLNLLSSITRHDINNQLNILMGFLEISKGSLADPAITADFITKEEKIADAISRQIMFTKDYENMGVNAPSWQDTGKIVADLISRLPVCDVKIRAEDAIPEIFADPLLEKVFYNLIENALRYGGQGMKEIRITSRRDDSDLVIAVQDDGEGVRSEEKDKIFLKGFGQNTGLGLFLSREILAITGITIIENGVTGRGARFEIRVPKGGFRYRPGISDP
jgi:PAS domain S-box-containing protein